MMTLFGLYPYERHLNMNAQHLKSHSHTDWDNLDQMADDETVTVTIDADVLAWFLAQGPEYQKRISAALRLYAEVHKEAA
jgi:uncharacterized protein (DUF4415 family)